MFTDEALVRLLGMDTSQQEANLILLDAILEERPDLTCVKTFMGYPLHAACAAKMPLFVVRKLVDAFPKAVSCSSSDGLNVTPLFLACNQRVPDRDIVKYLVAKDYPSCLEGTRDRPPLFHYCVGIWAHSVEVSRELTDWVLSMFPGAADLKDFQGRYPIHYATSTSDTERFRLRLRDDGNKGATSDKDGNNVLHLAVASDSHRVERNLVAIMEECRITLSSPNLQGELPVHVCSKKSDRILLLRFFPFALLFQSNNGQTVIGNCRQRLQSYMRVYYPLDNDDGEQDHDGDEDEIEVGEQDWEIPTVVWLLQPHQPHAALAELDHMFHTLRASVVPALYDTLAQASWTSVGNSLPPEVVNEILLFAVPHFDEMLVYTPYMQRVISR